jgi:ssRNA-specific RNase YbeY (16S rRNA maturation enzyme)
MKLTNISIALVLSETRNAELEKKIKGFENLTKVLSLELDKQREEIETMKQRKVLKFNNLRKAA